MQKFVRIVNRKDGEARTNRKRALNFVSRGMAAVVSCTDTGVILEIRMLEEAELAVVRSMLRKYSERDPVTGNFSWFVGDSGGSRLMKRYEGVSGGYRVYQATHGS